MTLQSFVSRNLPTISASWLNQVDRQVVQAFGAVSGIDSGAVNAAVVTLNGTLTDFVRAIGTTVNFTPNVTNTGPSTANVNGTGVAAIVNQAGNALTGGELSQPLIMRWTGTNWRIVAGSIPVGNARTAAEISALIVPSNYLYPSHESAGGIFYVERYGFVGDANTTGSTGTDDTLSIQTAINVANTAFLGGSLGGNGGIVKIPAKRFRYTGLTMKKGTSLHGSGSLNTVAFLSGANATGVKCLAADTGVSADQISYGSFQGITFACASDVAPVAQIQWNAIGFSRWRVQECLFIWNGNSTGISVQNSVPASLGGPAQFYNDLIGVELLHSGSNGGTGALLGDSDTSFEGITTWTWIGGRASSNGTGTARDFRGASGCQSIGFVTENCAVGLVVGNSSGARLSTSNVFMDYFEGNTTNRSLKATSNGTMLLGCFVTGGSDTDVGIKTIFMEFGASEDFRIPSGLRFASTSASVDALDAYLESTFTPQITFATPGDFAATYGASNAASYTRIGNRFIVDIDLHITNLTFTTAAGDLRITGLPIAPASGTPGGGPITFLSANVTFTAGKTFCNAQVTPGQTYLVLVQNGSATVGTNVGVANLTTGNPLRLQLSLVYRV